MVESKPFRKGESSSEEVVEEYSIDEYVSVKIIRDPATDALTYFVIEPEVSDEEYLVIDDVKKWFVEEYPAEELEPAKISLAIENATEKFAKRRLRNSLNDEILSKLIYLIRRDILGFGKLDPLLKDPNIEDVSVIGVGRPVYVWHRFYENIPTNVVFIDAEELDKHLQKLMLASGKFVSLSRPIIDGTLPMGYRIHVVHSSISEMGTSITIRKYREIPFTVVDLIRLGTIAPELVGFLWLILEHKRSVFIIGETASGKTTLLNAIASLIPTNMKIVVIEEVREIKLPHPNSLYLVAREGVEQIGEVTLYDLVKSSMRQRPDFIIVGEVRGEEAYVLLQAIALGHGGGCTMHAEGPLTAIKRLMAPPMNIPPYLIKLIDVMIHISKVRIRGGIRRYVLSASEIANISPETKEPVLHTVYRVIIDEREGAKPEEFTPETSMTLRRISELKGIALDVLVDKVYKRADFLRKLSRQSADLDQIMMALSNYRD
jgi:flagellar protein FlaI